MAHRRRGLVLLTNNRLGGALPLLDPHDDHLLAEVLLWEDKLRGECLGADLNSVVPTGF
jgi:hypothetical protein